MYDHKITSDFEAEEKSYELRNYKSIDVYMPEKNMYLITSNNGKRYLFKADAIDLNHWPSRLILIAFCKNAFFNRSVENNLITLERSIVEYGWKMLRNTVFSEMERQYAINTLIEDFAYMSSLSSQTKIHGNGVISSILSCESTGKKFYFSFECRIKDSHLSVEVLDYAEAEEKLIKESGLTIEAFMETGEELNLDAIKQTKVVKELYPSVRLLSNIQRHFLHLTFAYSMVQNSTGEFAQAMLSEMLEEIKNA